MSMDPLYRPCLTLMRAREQLHQASVLAQQAAALLAELSIGHSLDLKAEIKFATDARKICYEAVCRLDGQIAITPL